MNRISLSPEDVYAANVLACMSRERSIPFQPKIISKSPIKDKETASAYCDRDMKMYVKQATKKWFHLSNQILNSIAKDVSQIKSYHFGRKHKVHLYRNVTKEEINNFKRTCWELFNHSV